MPTLCNHGFGPDCPRCSRGLFAFLGAVAVAILVLLSLAIFMPGCAFVPPVQIPGVDVQGQCFKECEKLSTPIEQSICGLACMTPPPAATATSTPTVAPTASPTAVATVTPTAASVQPPPYCFSNGGSGVGNPPFTEIKYQQHALKIDFTWWHWMGEPWRDKYACGGPNQNSKPCWSGGICSPCDPDHAAAFNGPCGGREWGPVGPGTVATFSGPGYAGETWPDDSNPFADVWMRYNPGLPVHAKYCPPADMKDIASGLVIPIKGYYSASGCREVDFIAPGETP